LVISHHNSFPVLFDKIASVHFIWKIYFYFTTGNGQPGEPALCQLYRHTVDRSLFSDRLAVVNFHVPWRRRIVAGRRRSWAGRRGRRTHTAAPPAGPSARSITTRSPSVLQILPIVESPPSPLRTACTRAGSSELFEVCLCPLHTFNHSFARSIALLIPGLKPSSAHNPLHLSHP